MSNVAAVKRLQRDLKELLAEPFTTVSAAPLDDNIMEWHANLKGPLGSLWEGAVFHLSLVFPETYPHSPPDCFLFTGVPHPNVINSKWNHETYPGMKKNHLCLDMLHGHDFYRGQSYHAEKYVGWSSAYSVTSILLQLQGFLFAEDFGQFYYTTRNTYANDKSIVEAKKDALVFHCRSCTHKPGHVWPTFSDEVPVCEDTAVVASLAQHLLTIRPDNYLAGADESVTLSPDKLGCRNIGRVGWGGVYAKYPAAANRNHFFEVLVEDGGSGLCRIGFATETGSLIIGTDTKSFGFGATGKKSFANSFSDYGEPFSQGSVIGCELDRENDYVQFYKNGHALGVAYHLSSLGLLQTPLYPAVTVKDAQVSFNFGTVPFANGSPASAVGEHRRFLEKKAEEEKLLLQAAPPAAARDLATVLSDNLLLKVFASLRPRDLLLLRRTCRTYRRVVVRYNLLERCELRCFHSKASFEEGVLGVGVSLKRYPSGELEALSTPLDLLSHASFLDGVRMSAWKEPFTHFLPLCFDEHHMRRAGPVMAQSLQAICGQGKSMASMVLEVLPKLMNSFVVELMKDGGTEVRRHASEKALQGYCAMHHLLLALAKVHPAIIDEANRRVDAFVSDTAARTKSRCPNLGEFLVLLTLTTKRWTTVSIHFIRELFDRNVRWLLRDHPDLGTLEPDAVSAHRLRTTYEATRTSTRLTMFQVHFLQTIGRPEEADGVAGPASLQNILEGYNRSCGRPSLAMQEALQAACKAILDVPFWPQFFDRVAVSRPSQEYLCSLLKEAVKNSHAKGYHHHHNNNNSNNNNRAGYRNGGFRGTGRRR